MKISVEMSLYPLSDDFLPMIQDIVARLNQADAVSCITNSMSTQLFGDFDAVMKVVEETLRYSFTTYGKQVFITKFLNSDVNPGA